MLRLSELHNLWLLLSLGLQSAFWHLCIQQRQTKNLSWNIQAPWSTPNCSHYKHCTHGTSSSNMTGNRSPILSHESCARRSNSKQPWDRARFLRGIFTILLFVTTSKQTKEINPCTDLDKALRRQKVEGTRISRQSAQESCVVVSLRTGRL